MGCITRKQILGQLKRDLIGKDSHRGVTLTYSWLANQFGHFSLGFIPTFILFLIIQTPESIQQSAAWAAIYVTAFWLLFETYNFLGPLLWKRTFKSVVRFRKKIIFKPAWKNIALDTGTDLLFFALGACVASLILYFSWTFMIACIVLMGFLLYLSSYWYVTKIYMQAAQYPFHMRLGQWDKEISTENMETVEKFRKNVEPGHHLLVFGAGNAGKSSLCIGLATEISIAHGACTYTTVMKLFSMFFEHNNTNPDNFWTWRTADLLIIDDINAGDPVEPDVVTTNIFLNFLAKKNEEFKTANQNALKEKNVIWVLGNEPHTKTRQQTWEDFLQQLNIDKSKISIINLTGTPVDVKKQIPEDVYIKGGYDYHKQSLPNV